MGKLVLLTVPIGNVGDLTANVEKALASKGHFAVEDTRRFKQLLNVLKLDSKGKSIQSLHDHSSPGDVESFLRLLRKGETLHVASEAGSPVVSDPAWPLIRAALDEGHEVESHAGISAPIRALEVSGLPPIPFHIHGFPPKGGKRRKEFFQGLSAVVGTHCFFESPYRFKAALKTLSELIPDSEVAVCRELTKMHEEVVRGLAGDAQEWAETIAEMGEVSVLVHISRDPDKKEKGKSADEIEQLARECLDKGTSPKRVAKLIAGLLGLGVDQVYDQLSVQKNSKK